MQKRLRLLPGTGRNTGLLFEEDWGGDFVTGGSGFYQAMTCPLRGFPALLDILRAR